MNLSAALQSAASWTLTTSVAASVIAAIILLVQFILRKRLAPQWKNALWMLVVLRLLLPIVPESPFSFWNLAGRNEAPHFVEGPAESVAIVPPPQPETFEGSVAMSAAPPTSHFDLAVALAWGWFAVVLVMLLPPVIGAIRFNCKLRKFSSPCEDPVILDVLDCVKRSLRCNAFVRVKVTSLVTSPALFGLVRPTLLLPVDFGRMLSPTEQEHVFAHELAHLQRRDLWTDWLLIFVRALHWFNPLVWLTVRACRSTRELACDARAIDLFAATNPQLYGQTLLKLLSHSVELRSAPARLGIVESYSAMEARIQSIRSRSRTSPGIGAALLIALLLCGFTSAQSQPPTIAMPKPSGQTNAPTIAAPQGPNAEQRGRVATFPNVGRRQISEMLKSIRLTEFSLPQEVSLREALQRLDKQGRQSAPHLLPPNFIIAPPVDTPAINPLTGLPIAHAESMADLRVQPIEPLRELSLEEALKTVLARTILPADAATVQLVYELEDYGIVITRAKPQLYTRRFKIAEPSKFLQSITATTEINGNDLTGNSNKLQHALRKWLSEAGAVPEPDTLPVTLEKQGYGSPPRNAYFYSGRTGWLFIRATLEEIDAAARAVDRINNVSRD